MSNEQTETQKAEMAQGLFNEIIKCLSGCYMAATQESIKGTFKIINNLEEIVEAEGLPDGIKSKDDFLRAARYVGIMSTQLTLDPTRVQNAIRSSDLEVIINIIEELCGAPVNNTSNLILPSAGIKTPTEAAAKNVENSKIVDFPSGNGVSDAIEKDKEG
jgi:hypothetical protein